MVPRKSATELLYDELRRRAERSLAYLHEEWRRLQHIRPLAVTWVSDHVVDDHGQPIDDFVTCFLPDDESRHVKVVHEMVGRTKACALMLIRQQGDEVQVIYETPIGTTSWIYKIEDRVNTKILGKRTIRKDTDYVGVMWSPSRGQA